MKKSIILIATLLLQLYVQADTWDSSASDKSWYDQTKTEFYISTAAQLKGLANIVNDGTYSFKETTVYLENDIDLDNHPWVPIGYGFFTPKSFCGTFNGNAHTISNLYISTDKLTGVYYGTGFFGNAGNAMFLIF